MMPEVIGRIVGGAYNVDTKFLKNGVPGQTAGQCSIRPLPDCRSGLLIEQFRNAEVALQLQVRPVIERIAQRVGHGSRPGQKFLVGRGAPSDVLFRNPIGPHGPPFVVVSLQPDLKQICELPIFRNVLRGKMAVIIEDRLGRRKPMVKAPCGIVRQKEIFGEKAGHGRVRVRRIARCKSSDSSQESYQFRKRLTERLRAMCSDARAVALTIQGTYVLYFSPKKSAPTPR